MKKLVLMILAVFMFSMNITIVNAETIYGEMVEITQEKQAIDSITYNGVTVYVYYSPHTPYGTDNRAYMSNTGLTCSEFVSRFFATVYKDVNYTFEKTNNPVVGDWVAMPGHDALIKDVYTDASGRRWALLIEQNYWLAFGSRYALRGRRITIDDANATYLHPVVSRPPVNEELVIEFVKRLYRLCLNREADKGGLKYWTDQLVNRKMTAAEVADGFFDSKELKNSNLDNKKYIERCYLAMMDRSYDKGGLNYWNNILENGASRKRVVKGFVDSKEFTNICNEFRVDKGTIKLSEARDINDGVTAFVSRCYTKIVERKAEVNGLNFWCDNILSASSAKDEASNTARSFFDSKEFLYKNASEEEFIKICYRTFLDREAESSGLKYWKKEMDNKGKYHVLNGFASSTEFKNILAKYGLK